MQPAVSEQNVRRVSPVWLRPTAFALVLGLHLAVLVGIPWPAGTDTAEPPPVEIQVIPLPDPAPLLVPLDSAQVAEVKPANAVAVDVQAVEAQALAHGQEVAELKPSEPALAADSPQAVLASPAPPAAELAPLAARPATAPVQVAQPAPEAARVAASAVPVEAPGQDPLPASEQRVAESESLAVLPAAAPPATPAAREDPQAASALPIEPPSRPLSSEQHVAESEPLAVQPAAAPPATPAAHEAPQAQASALPTGPPSRPVSSEQHAAESAPLAVRPAAGPEVAQAAREAARAQASALPTEPPSRPVSSEQHAAESAPLAVRPAAVPEVAQAAREAARAQASTLPIEPPSRPLSSGQQVAELAPLEMRPAAALSVGPSVSVVPLAESSTTASGSSAPGTVLSSEQQVAKVEPYSPRTAAPLQDEGPVTPGRIGRIVRYVEQYDGGRCFFVAPVAVTETEAKLEGYGASARPFEALDAAFRHENGFEASIDVRLVNPAQCPAVTFLGQLRASNPPHLRIDGASLRAGGALTGSVDGYGSRNIELLVATDAGTVQNVSHLLKPDTAAKTFTIGLRDIARASGGQPQLLIVVASPLPLDALHFDRPVAADRLFAAALGEAAKTNQPVAAMARYFKIER